ncbi:MAG: hypothetical protein ACRDDZ_11100 [Marinifilaceae bacterium]
MAKLTTLNATLVDGKYVSESVQLDGINAAIQVKVSVQSTFTVQRSITGDDFCDIPGLTVSTDGISEVGVTGGIRGQFLRVVCTNEPTSIKALV